MKRNVNYDEHKEDNYGECHESRLNELSTSQEAIISNSDYIQSAKYHTDQPGTHNVDAFKIHSRKPTVLFAQTRHECPCKVTDTGNDDNGTEQIPPPRKETTTEIIKPVSKDFRPIWYQQAKDNSSHWFDGAEHYNKKHDPSNQIGAFAPTVDVEKMVRKEKKKRGIKDQPVYSNEDTRKDKKKKKNAEETTNIINVYQRQPSGQIKTANQENNNRSGPSEPEPVHTTNVLYDIQRHQPKSKRHHKQLELPYQSAPLTEDQLAQVPFAASREFQLYPVNTHHQHKQTSKPRENSSRQHNQDTSKTSRSNKFPSNHHSQKMIESTHVYNAESQNSARYRSPSCRSQSRPNCNRNTRSPHQDNSGHNQNLAKPGSSNWSHSRRKSPKTAESPRKHRSKHKSPENNESSHSHRSKHRHKEARSRSQKSHSRHRSPDQDESSQKRHHSKHSHRRKVTSKDLCRSNSRYRCPNRNSSAHASSTRATSSGHTQKSTGGQSEKHIYIDGKGSKSSQKPHYKRIRKVESKSPSGVLKSSDHKPVKRKQYCKCNKEQCHCKRPFCVTRDRPKPEPEIASVHKAPSKKIREPEPVVVTIHPPKSSPPPKPPTPPPSPPRNESPNRPAPQPPTTPTPVPSSQRYESPIRTSPPPPPTTPRPVPSSQRYESPIRTSPPPPPKTTTPEPSPPSNESPIRTLPPPREPSPPQQPPPSPPRQASPPRQPSPPRYVSPIRTLPPPREPSPPPPPPSPLRQSSPPRQPSPPRQSSPPREASPPRQPPPPAPRESSPPPQPNPEPEVYPDPVVYHATDCPCPPEKTVDNHPVTNYPPEWLGPQVTHEPLKKVHDYAPIWYQRTGNASEDWTDGSAYHDKLYDPSNQIGAFAPNVDVEKMVRMEKRKKGIPDMLPYSNEDLKRKKKKKNKKQKKEEHRREVSRSPSQYAPSSAAEQSGTFQEYTVSNLKVSYPVRWDIDLETESTEQHEISSTPAFGSPLQRHTSPPLWQTGGDPYSRIPMDPAASSVYAISSVSSGTGKATATAFKTQAQSEPDSSYNPQQPPCKCAIEDCQCMIRPCLSRGQHQKDGDRMMPCISPSMLSACSRGRTTSAGNGRSVFVRRESNSAIGDFNRFCNCKTEYCTCIYNPCASRKRGRRKRRLKMKAKKEFKIKQRETPDDGKCFLCKIKAVEASYNCCMSTCCTTCIWSDREFMRHSGKKPGLLPDYADKPPSLNESALNRCWDRRFVVADEDEALVFESERIKCYCADTPCPGIRDVADKV